MFHTFAKKNKYQVTMLVCKVNCQVCFFNVLLNFKWMKINVKHQSSPIKSTKYLPLTCPTCTGWGIFRQVVVPHCKVQIKLIKHYHFSYDVVPLITTVQLPIHTANLRHFSGDKVCSKLLHVVQIVT